MIMLDYSQPKSRKKNFKFILFIGLLFGFALLLFCSPVSAETVCTAYDYKIMSESHHDCLIITRPDDTSGSTSMSSSGFIVVQSNPSGATLFLDSVNKGITPLTIESAPAVGHVMLLRLNGYQDLSTSICVCGGSTLPIDMTLKPITTATTAATTIPTTASVTTTTKTIIGGNHGWYVVHCNVNGATVMFDNTVEGTIVQGTLTVPVYTTGTPFTTYTVSMNGYTPYTSTIPGVPGNGQTFDLYATLNPVALTTTTTEPITTVLTTPVTTPTPTPTETVNYSATIAAMQSQIAEQNTRITEQGNILDQITRFFRNIFGWNIVKPTPTNTPVPTTIPSVTPTSTPQIIDITATSTPIPVTSPTPTSTPTPTTIPSLTPTPTQAAVTTTAPVSAGIANPASVNCGKLGGKTEIKKDAQGNEYGMCTFTDGTSCDEWALFRNEGCKPFTPTTQAAVGLANPASVNCGKVGATSVIMNNPDGSQYGMCKFPDGTVCEEWALFRGEGCKPNVAPTPQIIYITVTPTPTPTPSVTISFPQTTTAPAVPTTGVYVRISYIGGWKGTYGMPAALQTVDKSGDRFYEIENAKGPVQATFEKLDGSTRHELVVEIYKNGQLLTSGKTSDAFGKVTVSADATTGVAQTPTPIQTPNPTPVTTTLATLTPGPTQSLPDAWGIDVQVASNGEAVDPQITVTCTGGKGLNVIPQLDVIVTRSDGVVETGSIKKPLYKGSSVSLRSTTKPGYVDRTEVWAYTPQGDKVKIFDAYVPFRTYN